MAAQSEYIGYPEPVEAPVFTAEAKEYRNISAHNPTLTGYPLTLASRLISSLTPLQSLLYNNAEFSSLRKLSVLKQYAPRWEPLVVPRSAESTDPADTSLFTQHGDHTFYTSADYVAAYKDKKTTPTAVAEYLLALVKQPPHNLAFIQIRDDLTLQAAQASTNRYANGTTLGPLDGVPIVVKDEVDINGYRKTFGSAKVFDNGEGPTSWCVKKLEEAGAIIIGKANMHELGTDTTNNNPVTGTPRNPVNQAYYTGGSSGGSAYAVGSGLVPIAVAADGGGSIRIPSNYCGVYGIKASHGRISAYPSVSLTSGNGVVGPIASSLPDLALAYRIMSQPAPADGWSSLFPSPRASTSSITRPGRRVIGIYRPWFNDSSSTVAKLCNEAVDRLVSAQGYELVEIPFIPYLNEARKSHALSISSDMSVFVNGDYSGLNAANKIMLATLSQAPAIEYNCANKVRSMIMSHFASIWQQHPGLILVTPTTPFAGVKIDEKELSAGVSNTNRSLESMRYVFLSNFIGAPSINSVVGYEEGSGMPISLMGLAEWGKEEDLFGFAEDVAKGFRSVKGRKRGQIWVDVLGGVGVNA
ncbi:amidase signature enzyme [Panus rudis PR-1116 ss-1]|nr:amidase signature enzyme [Panus rudis PR-1116 ss-1]